SRDEGDARRWDVIREPTTESAMIGAVTSSSSREWPALPLADWRDTYATVHRWVQMIGKTRLRFSPMQNHWWQTTLYLTSRGLTTAAMSNGLVSFEVALDSIDHRLVISTSDAAMRTLSLAPRTVAEFYREYV